MVKARRYEKVVTPEKITQNLEESPIKSLDEEITLETAGSLPRRLQETAKSPQKPCQRCKTSEATCDFLVSYQPFFDFFANPLKSNYPRLICQNCDEYFQVCVKNSALKSDLETEKSRSDKLAALKDLKVNSFSINVRNLDQKNLSNYDRIKFEKYLKANSEKPPKSYCEMADENTQLKAEIDKLNDEHDIELNRVKEKIRLLQSEKSENPSKEILVENKKLRKSIDKLEEEHESDLDRLKEKIKTLQTRNSELIAKNYSSPQAEKKPETSDENMKLKEEIKKLKNEHNLANLEVKKLEDEKTKLQDYKSVQESKNAKSSQLEDELEKIKKDKELNEMKLDAYFRQNNEYREKIKKIEESEHEKVKEIEEKIRREFSQKIQGNLSKGIDKKTDSRKDIDPIKSFLMFSSQ